MLTFNPFNDCDQIDQPIPISLLLKKSTYHFYYGHWNENQNKPDGLGLAISKQGEVL